MKQTFFHNKNSFLKALFLFLLFNSFLYGENGLIGKYYERKNFSGANYTKIDKNINFFQKDKIKYNFFTSSNFSVIWSGYLYVDTAGDYIFRLSHDDGVELRVGGVIVIQNGQWTQGDTFSDSSHYRSSSNVYMNKTGFFPIELRYKAGGSPNHIRLGWTKPNFSTIEVIPTQNLFTTMPNVIIKAPSVTVTEGDVARVKVEAEGIIPSGNEIVVEYTTKNDTAYSPTNYTAQSGTLRFTSTNKIKYIDIQTKNDGVVPNVDPLKFRINFTSSQRNFYTEVGIKDKKEMQLSFTEPSYRGKPNSKLKFSISLNTPSTENFSVRYKTRDGTAKKMSDYAPKEGILTFNVGDKIKHIEVDLLANSGAVDTSKEFYMDLIATLNTPKIVTKSAIGIISGVEGYEDDANVLDSFQDCDGSKCKSVNLKRDFALRFGGAGYNAYGDMSATGESIICPQGNDSQGCNWKSTNAVENETTTAINEANFARNSSYATLVMPDEVSEGKQIVFARLYWQGFVSKEDATSIKRLKEYIRGWSKIKFQTPIGKYELKAEPADTNWLGFWGKGGRFAYQASVDVTRIMQNYFDSSQFKSSRNKTFAAGDIVATTEGKDPSMIFHSLRSGGKYDLNTRWGHWGGWSLVVAYDVGEPLGNIKYKNIAIYDGFVFLIPWLEKEEDSISIDVDGFYTPTSGKIDASMTLFSGAGNGKQHPSEGSFELKNTITKRWHSAYNDINPKNHPLNGTYTYKNSHLVPGRENHAATDLDTFDVSEYMSNKQTSTTLRLSGKLTNYYAYSSLPSMIAFSTEIYSPNVCYEEHIYYQGKEVPFEIKPQVGSVLTTKLSIRNEGYEDAEKIRFWTSFDQNFSYEKDSLLVGNTNSNGVATSLVANSPLATITYPNEFGDTNISLNLGRGATASSGGDFKAMRNNQEKDEARVDYNMSFFDPDFKVKKYFVAYENKALGLSYKGRIFECKESNRSFRAGILGDFNVVNKNFSGNEVSNDENSTENALYTQIAGKPFDVKILSLKNKNENSNKIKELAKFTGDINVTLVEIPSYETCSDQDTLCHERNRKKCIKAKVISDKIAKITFRDEKQKTYNFTYNEASDKAVFRIIYQGVKESKKCVTSLDKFAIRPSMYSIDLNETALKGGKIYAVDANATRFNEPSSITKGYSTPLDVNISLYSDFPATCTINETNSTKTRFVNGNIAPTIIVTKNIGDYNISIHDKEWTKVDRDKIHNGISSSDCIVGSSTIIENMDGKIGCDINATKRFSFSPEAFRANLNLANFKGGDFTYVADNKTASTLEMNATITIDVAAILSYNAPQTLWTAKVAETYDKNCYAKDINVTLQLLNNPAHWDYPTSAASRILFEDDGGLTTHILSQLRDGNVTITSKEGNFTKGENKMTLLFNFDRNISQPQNPFNIQRRDFNITEVIDSTNTKGEDINRTLLDTNATFYYGRIHAPRDYYRGKTPLDTIIYYEVYCDGCDKFLYAIDGDESIDSMNWFINPLHVNTDLGEVLVPHANNYRSVSGDSTMEGAVVFSGDGKEKVTWKNSNAPAIDRIELYADSWLIFNKFNSSVNYNDYNIEFIGGGNWVGEGTLGEVAEPNIADRVNKRLEW